MAAPDNYTAKADPYTGVTWTGSNADDLAVFTDSRSSVRQIDGSPLVAQVDVSPEEVLLLQVGDTLIKKADGTLLVVTPAQLAAAYDVVP